MIIDHKPNMDMDMVDMDIVDMDMADLIMDRYKVVGGKGSIGPLLGPTCQVHLVQLRT